MCSGSQQLLHILNALGCITSPDTHERFVIQHAEVRRHDSIWNELSQQVFTVASVEYPTKLCSSLLRKSKPQLPWHHNTIGTA